MVALDYLAHQAIYRLQQFFVHWYGHGYFIIGGLTINALERLDRIFALKITWRYFGQPLFKDYTYMGYFLGFIFRSARILISVIVYALVVAVFAAIYILWSLIPPLLILKIING